MKSIISVLFIFGVICAIVLAFNNYNIKNNAYLKANISDYIGSPVNNDESNDQPAGFSGLETMNACNKNNGDCYDLIVDSDGKNIERIYFPKGGWVGVAYSSCDNGHCYVTDENGNDWELKY